MRYKDARCVFCDLTFAEKDDVVVCPVCGAPHHRECWNTTGKCACGEKHADGFVWEFPAEVLKSREQEKTETDAFGSTDEKVLSNGEKIILCPYCGEKNYERDMYCSYCGQKLHPERNETFGETGGRTNQGPYAPYASPERNHASSEDDGFHYREIRSNFDLYGGLDPTSMIDGIPCWEYSEYVGGTKPGRILRKVSIMERFNSKFSWILPAFLFGPIWFFYRKMKKEGFLITLAVCLLSFALTFAQLTPSALMYYREVIDSLSAGSLTMFDEEGDRNNLLDGIYDLAEEYSEAMAEELSGGRQILISLLQTCMTLGVPIACALLALPRYRKKIRADILKIRTECGDMNTYRDTLYRRGGTSAGLAFLGILLRFMIFLVTAYLPIIIAMMK